MLFRSGPAYHHEIASIEYAEQLTGIPQNVLEKGVVNGAVEPYFLSGWYSLLTTVSPWYAEELTDPNNDNTAGLSRAFFENDMHIFGITNGIDFDKYDPTNPQKSLLPYAYDPGTGDLEGKFTARKNFVDFYSHCDSVDEIRTTSGLKPGIEQFGYIEEPNNETVYFSYHGRVVHQKGLDILAKAVPKVIKNCPNVRFVITGPLPPPRLLPVPQSYIGSAMGGSGLLAKGRSCLELNQQTCHLASGVQTFAYSCTTAA